MSLIELRVGGRFRLKESISHGSFGEIYVAQNVQTNEEVAVKLEDTKSKYPQLIYEAKILYSLQGGSGIPNLIWCGQEGDYNILVLELLGESVENLFNLCNRKLSLKSILMLADQLLQLLEFIHNKGFLHRDIKPENFLIGLGRKSHVIHLIDYGLAKRYRDPKTGKHIPSREGKQLTGTAKFVSLNTHQGFEQSRRDDLEALGYILVYLYKGGLPWDDQQNHSPSRHDRNNAIYEKKVNTSIKELCSDMPGEFATYFGYCRRLQFEDKPDYTYLRRLFKELFIREGYEFDHVYDWVLVPLRFQLNLESYKVALDLEISQHDDFMNYNIFHLDTYKNPVDNRSPIKTDIDQEAEKDKKTEDIGKGVSALIGKGKPKPKPKPIETEYLRTDFKLANMPSPSNIKSPKQNTLQNQKSPEKKKDCNIF